MEFDIRIRFYTKDRSWLCFRHAVQRAQWGEDVKTEIDDFGSEYYLGTTSCVDCSESSEELDQLLDARKFGMTCKKIERK